MEFQNIIRHSCVAITDLINHYVDGMKICTTVYHEHIESGIILCKGFTMPFIIIACEVEVDRGQDVTHFWQEAQSPAFENQLQSDNVLACLDDY